MRKIILALLACFILIGCQPAETAPQTPETATPPAQETAPPVETTITEPEPTPEPTPETAATPEALPTGVDLQNNCDKLVTIEEFASICGIDDATRITTTAKASEKTCWVTFVDRMARSYTAGFTTVDWVRAEEVNSEFERGMSQRRALSETTVGDRNYGFAEINRANIVWQRGTFLTRIGASTQLCTKEQLADLARAVDGKLK